MPVRPWEANENGTVCAGEAHRDLSPVVGGGHVVVPLEVPLPEHLVKGVAEFGCLRDGEPEVGGREPFAK
jgi:hypothetical protein